MPAANWTRLGDLLMRRRIELDPRYVNRQAFAVERGISYRIASDAEHGRRDNYEPATVTALEAAYALHPGSIRRALAGGDLEPLPPAREPRTLNGSAARAAAPGGEAEAEAAFRDLLLHANPRHVGVLQQIGLTRNPDGGPESWALRLQVACAFLDAIAGPPPGQEAEIALPARNLFLTFFHDP